MKVDNPFIKGKIYTRKELSESYGKNQINGILDSLTHPYILIFFTVSKNGYGKEKWNKNKTICYFTNSYTPTPQTPGERTINAKNNAICHHQVKGKRIFLFRQVYSGVEFIDEMRYLMHNLEKQFDSEGNLNETITFHLGRLFSNDITAPTGKSGISDQITNTDLLGRKNLIEGLGNFYFEYSEKKTSPFYFGIFARWGMGKSSVIEMLSKYIKSHSSDKNRYLVCKIDCSLFHKKEKMWISILNKLLEKLSEKEMRNEVFKSKLFSFKTTFFFHNLWSWSKKKWVLTIPLLVSLSFTILYILYSLLCYYIPNTPILIPVLKVSLPIPKDYKEVVSLITVATLIYTLFKTTVSIFKQNVFLQDNRNEESSFIRSVNEYKQLITLINKCKKEKDLRILLVLDEMDRMHKDLLPDIIELIQLFKGLNDEQLIKQNSNTESNDTGTNTEKDNEKELHRSVISFAFSFNQDIMFPLIGQSISLNDKQLFINSYRKYDGYIEGEGKDAHLNYYKLGKEFMDKYLDLSVYLEEEIDYTDLVEELFKEEDDFIENNSEEEIFNSDKRANKEDNLALNQNESRESGNIQKNIIGSNNQGFPSFTKLEREIIKDTIKKYASKVETRKVLRLKNVLIILKKLNNDMDITNNEYEEELREFICDFLEIKRYSQQRILGSTVKEGDTIIDDTPKNDFKVEQDKNNKYLKFTDYFIHNK